MAFKKEELAALPVSGSNGLRAVCRKVAEEYGHKRGWISKAKRSRLIEYLGQLDDEQIPGEEPEPDAQPRLGETRFRGRHAEVWNGDEWVIPHSGYVRPAKEMFPPLPKEIWNGERWVVMSVLPDDDVPKTPYIGQTRPALGGKIEVYNGNRWTLLPALSPLDKPVYHSARELELRKEAGIPEPPLISGISKEELATKGVNAFMAFRDAILASAPLPTELDEERVKELIDAQAKAAQPTIHHVVEERLNALVDARVKEVKPQRPQVHLLEIKRTKMPNLKLGVVHPAFEVCLAILQQRIPLYLQGSAGGGKTTLGKQLAEALELKYTPYTVGPSTEEHHLLGMKWPTKEGPVYDEGAFYAPYKNGGLILLDELDNGGPDVNVNLNHLLGNGECLFPNGELITAHEDFCIVGGANTLGLGGDRQYIRNQQDAAFLDRWAFVKIGYDEGIEGVMAGADNAGSKPPHVTTDTSYSALDWMDRVKRIRKASTALNERVVVSPRAMLFGRQLMEGAKLKEDIVENVLIWNKMGDDVEKRIRAKVKEQEGSVL